MDELLATRDRMNRVSGEFLKTDLETALTFVSIARGADNDSRKRRNRQSARKAYDTVLRLSTKVQLTVADGRALKGMLDRLKSELEILGETF